MHPYGVPISNLVDLSGTVRPNTENSTPFNNIAHPTAIAQPLFLQQDGRMPMLSRAPMYGIINGMGMGPVRPVGSESFQKSMMSTTSMKPEMIECTGPGINGNMQSHFQI